jgi:thioredoxin-related protein
MSCCGGRVLHHTGDPDFSNVMKTAILFLLIASVSAMSFAAGPVKVTDISDALAKAETGGKLLFMQFGREACGNCQALKSYIKGGKIPLSPSKFVYADLNCDDKATSQVFYQKFKVSGSTLPFVVIAAADGTQLASRTGYGSPQDYLALIREAEKASKKK